MDLHAVFAPMPTPFAAGEVNRAAIRGNVSRWMTSPLGGIVVLGTNGEAALLDDDEADVVIATARESVVDTRTLIAGVGRESTRATAAAARRAAQLGADAVLVRTPSFYKAHVGMPALEAHYRAVADASPVPILLYNFPGLTGVNLPVPVIARLAEHPNIVGIKETSTDGAQFAELAGRIPSRFTILAGSAPGAFAALCSGARGAILAVACVLPDVSVRLFQMVCAGRYQEALKIQQQLTPIARAVTSGFGIAGLKTALNLAGYIGGDPRPPLRPAPAEAIEEIRRHLAQFEVS
jgi:dihydrodipicolinate synthase/N-acetylneuraminate lyase